MAKTWLTSLHLLFFLPLNWIPDTISHKVEVIIKLSSTTCILYIWCLQYQSYFVDFFKEFMGLDYKFNLKRRQLLNNKKITTIFHITFLKESGCIFSSCFKIGILLFSIPVLFQWGNYNILLISKCVCYQFSYMLLSAITASGLFFFYLLLCN